MLMAILVCGKAMKSLYLRSGVKDSAHLISDSQMFKYKTLPPNTPMNFGTGPSSHGIVLSGRSSYGLFLF